MSKPDEKIDALYQQRKSRVQPPDSIRLATLNAARKSEQQENKSWLGFGKQLHLITACLGVVMLGLLVKNTLQAPMPPTAMETHIERAEPTPEAMLVTRSRTADLSEAKHAYEQRQLTMAIHHREVAQIANTQGIWELRMCNQQSITLSEEVMQELALQNALYDGIKTGDFVQIAFSQNGKIIGIEKQTTPLAC